MKPRYALLLLAVPAILLSCQKRYKIEELARGQIYPSLQKELLEFTPSARDIRMEELNTVYVNDSICILQLMAIYDTDTGERHIDQLQYVFYYDRLLSMYNGKNMFKEEFRLVPCMTEKELKESKKNVRKTGEVVYDTFSGHGTVVNDLKNE